jgi:hypothetical protein
MALTAISPIAGPTEGGQNVTISGSGFEGAAPLVTIGTAAATNVVVMNDDTLSATTAANAAGTYDVTATSGAVTASLAQAYAYGGVATDAGTDAGADASTDAGDAGRDAATGGPTQGGPTQGSSSGGTNTGNGTNDAGTAANSTDDNDDGGNTDASTKRVSATKKKSTGGDDGYECACNEVGARTVPGAGAFMTMALAALAVMRIRKRR